jgi:DNA-binding NtrC family response regulator
MAHILVIDDDRLLRTFLRRVLERAGHEVHEAANGVEGLRLYRQRPADLVLCDLFMPEKEGFETMWELHRHDPGVRMVAMSGGFAHAGGADFLSMAPTFGAAQTLKKPFDIPTLLRAVQEMLPDLEADGGSPPKPRAGSAGPAGRNTAQAGS